MTDRSADILPANQSIGGVTDQLTGIPLHFPARRRWLDRDVFRLRAAAVVRRFCGRVVHARRRHLGNQHSRQLGICDPQLCLVARHRSRRHADLRAAAADRKRVAQLAQSFCRDHDAVRGGLRRHLPDPASRPALVSLLDVSLSSDDGRVAAVSQPAGMGHLGGPDLSHRYRWRSGTPGLFPISPRRATAPGRAAGRFFSASPRWAGAAPPFTGCDGRRPIG